MLMVSVIAFVLSQPDVGEFKFATAKEPVPSSLTAFPAMVNLTVGNSIEGDKGWIKLEDLLVDREGKAFIKKAAKMTVSEQPENKLCVRVGKEGALALDVWAFYVFEPTVVGNRSDLVEVKEIFLKFREKR